MGTTPSNILRPKHISDSNCWFLISQIAFQGRDHADNELGEIGKEIAKKCKGLPLAAKTLGGMLISKKSVDEWKEILNSEIWELEQAEVELFPHIFLSYQELPAVLKRCFLILAIFPKDTKLKVKEVIAIWMAHGVLNQGTKEDDIVKIGKKYLDFLVSRALLEEEKYDMISMHDIMQYFALHLSGDELISIDKIKNNSSLDSTSKGCSHLKSRTARHLYIAGKIHSPSIGFDVGKLRTCIVRNVASSVTSDLVNRLKMVRALYLVDCDLKQVPPSIEHLIHLRLLDLTANPLRKLPETIGGLFNLQQLCLEGSSRTLEKFPESVGKLINLQNLENVEVGDGKNKMELLKELNQLRVLMIKFQSDYGDEVDAKKAAIERKKRITEFTLNFNYFKVTNGVSAALQPPSNIQVLRIYGLPRSCDQLPSWITSLDHLTELELDGGGNVSNLPPLGKLQSLKYLQISEFNALKIIGREFIGLKSKPNKNCSYFPKLVELKFHYCNELTGWEDIKPEEEEEYSITVMQNLEILEFYRCGKLGRLPHRLLGEAPSLKFIYIKQEDSLFDFKVGESPYILSLIRNQSMLEMIVEGSTKVPKSIIYHSYITLLDFCFAEQPLAYLPPMGKLPYLESLTINEFRNLKLIGRDFLGIDDPNNDENFVAFPNLLKLKILDCIWLKEWEDLKPEDEGKVTAMPKLHRLEITDCPKLQVLPSRLLRQAIGLKELHCNDNNESLAANIMKDKQLLRHVKSVIVDNEQCSLHPSTKRKNERGSGTFNIL